jgi:hypothetical protein
MLALALLSKLGEGGERVERKEKASPGSSGGMKTQSSGLRQRRVRENCFAHAAIRLKKAARQPIRHSSSQVKTISRRWLFSLRPNGDARESHSSSSTGGSEPNGCLVLVDLVSLGESN